MTILDGTALSQQIINNLKSKDLSELSLHIILVGDNPSSLKYVSLKRKRCEEIGLNCVIHHLAPTTTEPELLDLVSRLNSNPEVTGFFIQLPLPKNINSQTVSMAINPQKDVDGLSPNSPFTPAVVRGVITLLENYDLSFAEKTAVIINDSKLIGIPLSKILISKKAKVIICNEFTQNIAKISGGADFVFSATGVRRLITSNYIKPGAVVVDIGGGDVDFASVSEVSSYITPTVGGVGPMTIASLLQNLVDRGYKNSII